MIVKENPVWASATRGTIQVYEGEGGDWRYRVKSKNGQILAAGEGYKRRSSCLDALDRLFSARLADELLRVAATRSPSRSIVIPWRLVVYTRDDAVEWIGQIR